MSSKNGFKEYSKNQSRKWRLALLVVILATLGAFFPPLFSMFTFFKPVIIITGTEWVSVITLVTGLYIGGNVLQKKIEQNGSSALPADEDDKEKAA